MYTVPLIGAALLLLLLPAGPVPGTAVTPAVTGSQRQAVAPSPPPLRLYPLLNAPLENPFAQRHWIKPAMFTAYNGTGGYGNTTHFAGHSANTLLGKNGDVIAPTFPFLFNTNLSGALDTLKQQEIYLTDINQYVPGVPVSTYGEYKPARLLLDSVEKIMSDAYTGMDNGEQDGRYLGEYAGQQYRSAGGDSHPVRALALAARGDELRRNVTTHAPARLSHLPVACGV